MLAFGLIAAWFSRDQIAENLISGQIDKLGPPPAAGQPAETPTVAAERARLNAMAGALDSAIKTTELAWVRAKQLIDRITVMRYQIFTRNLFERRESPMLPQLWRDVGSRMETVVNRSRRVKRHRVVADWNAPKSASGMPAAYATSAGLIAYRVPPWLGCACRTSPSGSTT